MEACRPGETRLRAAASFQPNFADLVASGPADRGRFPIFSEVLLLGHVLFFLCFSSPARVAFGWKLKKKKKKPDVNQTKIVRSASRSAAGAWHFHVGLAECRFVVEWTLSSRLIARRRDKTFSFCVVWWKKTIRSTSHTIRYSKSMMLYIHAHSSKIWANFNAFLRWSSGSLQRASLVTENQKPLCLLLKSPNMDSAEGNEVLLW